MAGMQAIDSARYLPSNTKAATDAAVTPIAAGMKGSMILKIAGQVRELIAQGRVVANFTVGDFRPEQFHVPSELSAGIRRSLDAGATNYPPADGVPELKAAIARLVERSWGMKIDPSWVCVGSGARPPIYSSWQLFVEPGDRTVSFLPMWNVGYYAHLFESDHIFVPTSADTDFFPTVEQARQAMRGARLVVINTPLNPTGTMIDPKVLEGIARALVEENEGRERPCMLLFDQVYWAITSGDRAHANPCVLVPECTPYVVHVDAISKWMCATGLRVGWAVLPPYLQGRMKALIGHMGAWAPRPEQLAAAALIDDEAALSSWFDELNQQVTARLERLYTGISRLRDDGLAVDAIAPQGGIYLSFRVNLVGRGFDSNEAIRTWLLDTAGVAVVPFQAFDMVEDSGWFRMSVGAVGLDDIDGALARLESALRSLG
ncbi:MAG: aminotransferase [Phycisphaerae bacterium]|nr:aminotransferase [Phycisphaerae bacterium]